MIVPKNLLIIFCLFYSSFLIVPAPVCAAETYNGYLSVYTDDNDRFESAELVSDSPQGFATFDLLLNEKLKLLVLDLDGSEVVIEGEIVVEAEDDYEQEYLSASAIYQVFYGSVKIEKNEEGMIAGIRLEEEELGPLMIKPDPTNRSTAVSLAGKTARAVGHLDKNNPKELMLKSWAECVRGTGHFEADRTRDGDVAVLHFKFRCQVSKQLLAIEIKLDQDGKSLYEEFGEDTVEINGILVSENNAQWLQVLACDYSYADEFQEESEDDLHAQEAVEVEG